MVIKTERRISVYIEEADIRKLKAMLYGKGQTMSVWLRKTIKDYIGGTHEVEAAKPEVKVQEPADGAEWV